MVDSITAASSLLTHSHPLHQQVGHKLVLGALGGAPPRQANHPDEVAAGRPLPTLQLRYDVVRDALVLSTGTRGVPVAEGEEVYFRYKEKTKCGSEAFRNTYGFVPQGFAPCHPDP